jgi:hypothetical protein
MFDIMSIMIKPFLCNFKSYKTGIETSGGYMSVILATWRTEMGRIIVPGQAWPKKFARLHLNGKKAGCGGVCLSSQRLLEV